MKYRREQTEEQRQTLERSALPVAPMAMPEQRLVRERKVFVLPFFEWLAWK